MYICKKDISMNEDHLNMEIRRFLKKVGITSQREIEKHLYEAEKKRSIKANDEIDLQMTLKIKQLDVNYIIDGKIKIE